MPNRTMQLLIRLPDALIRRFKRRVRSQRKLIEASKTTLSERRFRVRKKDEQLASEMAEWGRSHRVPMGWRLSKPRRRMS